MSDSVQLIQSEAEFDEITKSGVVLVDFFATWCGPCKMQSPILDQVAVEFAGKAKVVKVDTDKFQSLAKKFDISGIPTMFIFKGGQIFERYDGLRQAGDLAVGLNNALN